MASDTVLEFGLAFAPNDTFEQAFRETARMRRMLGIYGGNLPSADLKEALAALDRFEAYLRDKHASGP